MAIPVTKLRNQVTIRNYQGTNAYGEPVYQPPITLPALVVSERKLIRDKQGTETVSNTTVYLNPTNVPEGSQVTIWPDTNMQHNSTVIAVGKYEVGTNSHIFLELQ